MFSDADATLSCLFLRSLFVNPKKKNAKEKTPFLVLSCVDADLPRSKERKGRTTTR